MTTPSPLDALLNFARLSPTLLTAGQPTTDQFALVRQAGCTVVINLAMPTSPGALSNEADLVAAQGMTYVPLPVVWEQPTLDDLARFFAAMQTHAAATVLVHCALNYRASTFAYLYRVLCLHEPEEPARWDMLAVWEPDDTWAALIAAAFAHFTGKPE